jgi:hypothetical protein
MSRLDSRDSAMDRPVYYPAHYLEPAIQITLTFSMPIIRSATSIAVAVQGFITIDPISFNRQGREENEQADNK